MSEHRPLTKTVTSSGERQPARFSLPDRWTLETILGAGGQGEVWRAFDSVLGERVAIKVLSRPESSTAVERLKREVRVGRRLQNEHLVQVFELVEAGDSMAIVMEYLSGGSLSRRISDGGAPIDEVERIAGALLEALACLHREGVVHRDVKPSNVLFDVADVPKLADFGTLSAMSETGDLTATHLTVGTPAYMSPEQVRGEDPAPPSDLYALGVTLYHLLTSERPFEGGSEFDVARRHITDSPRSLRSLRPDCPRWMARFVHRLLEKSPADRWPDAAAALKAFRVRRWRPTRRSVLRAVTAMGIVLAAGTLTLAGADRWSTIRSSVDNGELVVRNAFGRTLWRRAMDGLSPRTLAADLVPGGGMEVLAAARKDQPDDHSLEMLLFGRDGSILQRSPVTSEFSGRSLFPGMTEELDLNLLKSVDFGRGSDSTVVWIASDRSWYPSLVGAWSESGPRTLLVNSGHCKAVRALDIDGDGRRELAIAGVNNEMGFQAFVAIVDPSRPGARSPDLFSSEIGTSGGAGLLGYAVLGETGETEVGFQDEPGTPERCSVTMTGRSVPVDSNGTIDGISPSRTMTFWADVVRTAVELRTQGNSWAAAVEDLRRRGGELWSKTAFRGGASLMLARALAEGGRPDDAASLLEASLESGVRLRRIHRRLGEMYLLAGSRTEGRSALGEAVELVGRGFGPIDECIDLGLDDALSQDPTAWTETSSTLKSLQFDGYLQQLEVVVNFFGGRFFACRLEPRMTVGVHYPAFVLKHWAAVEEGRATEGTVAALKALRPRAECSSLATLALARWEMVEGRPGEAVRAVGDAFWTIRNRARNSWSDAAYLPLAQWAYGTVLEAQGDVEAARANFREAASRAPDTFFGRDAARRLRGSVDG